MDDNGVSDRTLDTLVRRRGSRYVLRGAFAVALLLCAVAIYSLMS